MLNEIPGFSRNCRRAATDIPSAYMQFEVNLPPNLEVGLLRGAGVETQPYLDITSSTKFILGKMPPPTKLPCPFFFCDKPTQVLVSQISDDRKCCRLRIEVDDDAIGKQIR